jgi:uncharacterized membrane protein
MDPAHLHLLLNHLPVIGTVFGLLILMSGYILKQPPVKKTALLVFILSAVFALPAFLSGEGAEEVVEGLAVVENSFVETHEEWASVYVWFAGGLGILAAITLLFDFRKLAFSKYLYGVVLLLSLISIGISSRVSTTGGEIRHTEIRNGFMAATEVPSTGIQKEDEDD